MGPATLEGLDERSARLCLEQGWLAAPVNRLFRSAPFEEGYASRVADIELRVERLTSDARPACVRFSFPRTLEDPSLVWTRFEDGALRRFEAPRPGERVEIPAF
jgi:hypothetical protein